MKNLDIYTSIHVVMGAARQLIKGATSDKLAYLMQHLPQRIEDGQFINYKGEAIGATDLEDQELVKVERLADAKQITDALMNDLFHPLNTKVFSDTPDVVDEDEHTTVKPEKIVEEDDDESEAFNKLNAKLDKAIRKGKKEKAKELLKELEPSFNKPTIKEYKKEIKGMK